ncbi:MAG: hypothetical protein Q9162_001085 [Coniocarpon cinnabarinum]
MGIAVKETSKTAQDSTLKQEALAEFDRQTRDEDPASRREMEERLQDSIRRGDLDTDEMELLEEVAAVDKMVIWGHDDVPEASTDPFCKGVQEWVAMAEAVRNDTRAPHVIALNPSSDPSRRLNISFRADDE